MDKAERDKIARKMIATLYLDHETIDATDLADAFYSFLVSDVPLEDMLAWMLGYMGYGLEYLNATGANLKPSL